MLAFRSLDTFPPLREPDRRRRDEERPFRSKQGTGNKPKNHLTEKLPYRFESSPLQRRVYEREFGAPTAPAALAPMACGCSQGTSSQASNLCQRLSGWVWVVSGTFSKERLRRMVMVCG